FRVFWQYFLYALAYFQLAFGSFACAYAISLASLLVREVIMAGVVFNGLPHTTTAYDCFFSAREGAFSLFFHFPRLKTSIKPY
ncbi:MAG: hypothetical protein WCY41_04415, partial [Candidatus Micrarchaeia archaeon]